MTGKTASDKVIETIMRKINDIKASGEEPGAVIVDTHSRFLIMRHKSVYRYASPFVAACETAQDKPMYDRIFGLPLGVIETEQGQQFVKVYKK